MVEGAFLCPECGSTESREELFVETEPDDNNPWAAVLHIIECARCGFMIPAHLGERWNGRTVDAAREEWQRVYRATAHKRTAKDR
jgi:hypothetical protein